MLLKLKTAKTCAAHQWWYVIYLFIKTHDSYNKFNLMERLNLQKVDKIEEMIDVVVEDMVMVEDMVVVVVDMEIVVVVEAVVMIEIEEEVVVVDFVAEIVVVDVH